MITLEHPRRHGHLSGALILAGSLALCLLPARATATLADDIEAAVQETIQGMVGTEFGVDYVTFDFLGAVDMTVTVLGCALCEPPDPYAPPVAPVPPLNIYACENTTTVDADVAGDESGADLVIEFSKIYLDLESSRDETVLCALDGDEFPYDGIVTADGYMLGHAIVEVGVTLELVDGCYRANLVPDSVAFTLTPDVMASRDECLDANMDDVLMPILYPLVEAHMDAVFETALAGMMDPINELLCEATAVETTAWSRLKNLYR